MAVWIENIWSILAHTKFPNGLAKLKAKHDLIIQQIVKIDCQEPVNWNSALKPTLTYLQLDPQTQG